MVLWVTMWVTMAFALGLLAGMVGGDSWELGLASVGSGAAIIAIVTLRLGAQWAGAGFAVAFGILGGFQLAGHLVVVYAGLLLAFFIIGRLVDSRLVALGSREPQRELRALNPTHRRPSSLEMVVEREFGRARRQELPLVVVSFSLDRGTWNPFAARHTLTSVARILSRHLRNSDALGYVPGRRVVVVLPQTTPQEASGLINRLVENLDQVTQGRIRMGMAAFPKHGVTWTQLKLLARERESPLTQVPSPVGVRR